MSWKEIVVKALLIFLLILFNGFFSASEISLISAPRARIRHWAETGNEKGKLVYQLQNDPDRFLAAVQLGITLLSSLAPAIAGAVAIQFLKPLLGSLPLPAIGSSSESLSLLLLVLVVTYLIPVLGELVPKSLALQHSEKMALWVARPIDLHSVFQFTDTSAKEVMVPRPRIKALPIDSSLSDILAMIQEAGYSRFPIYGKDLDDVRGILYTKDVMRLLAGKKSIVLSQLLHPAHFVPETKMISDLLPELLRRRGFKWPSSSMNMEAWKDPLPSRT